MIHHVFANRSNIGDWLSARGIQSLLAPWPVREHLCDHPFVDQTLGALAGAGPSDFIVIGGGGLFMDYFAPFWDGFQSLASRLQFCLWGVGCCHLKREETRPPRKLLGSIIQQSALCVVRDELTREYLEECCLPDPIPCPTIVAVVKASSQGFGLLHADNYDNVGEDIYNFMTAASRQFARQTGRDFRRTNNLIPAGNHSALAETMSAYNSSDLVLTSRLHGCIIGLAMGRKILAVSGDSKVESFMEAAGLGKWVLDLHQIDQLPQRLSELSYQHEPVEFIRRGREQNQAVAAKVRTLITAKEALAPLRAGPPIVPNTLPNPIP